MWYTQRIIHSSAARAAGRGRHTVLREVFGHATCDCGKPLTILAWNHWRKSEVVRCDWCGRMWRIDLPGAPVLIRTADADPVLLAPTTQVYDGQLALGSNGEEEDILYFADDMDTPLAEIIADAISAHGNYLSVRYYVADTPLGEEEPTEAFFDGLYGLGSAEYWIRYSEITGYLWTDESVVVGGHDILAELKAAAGKWLWMEIVYNKLPKPAV